jgi:3-dehydroquinate synthase II
VATGKTIYFLADPYDKEQVTMALESGVDAIIATASNMGEITSLSRVDVADVQDMHFASINDKDDENAAAELLAQGHRVCLRQGVEIIPVENLLAARRGTDGRLGMEVRNAEEARLALGILEQGADFLIIPPDAVMQSKAIIAEAKLGQGRIDLVPGRITEIKPVGLGHRVCVDTLSILATGEGMLVGNSSAFTFLVHGETEENPYVASRPFRVNAGAVHSYVFMPGDTTRYLEELGAGDEVLIVDHAGNCRTAVTGRLKTEVRPMLLIKAVTEHGQGSVFLQNAETIRMVRPGGEPVSVVSLQVGDEILCRMDSAGRHFGMRVDEDIREG